MSLVQSARRSRVAVIGTAGALALAGSVVVALPAAAAPGGCETRNNNTVAKLTECVTVDGVTEHLTELQRIADANGGNRASGTPGYDASAEYVQQRLRAAGWQVSSQQFEFPFYELLGEPTLTVDGAGYDYPDQFRDMTYSGTGTVTGLVVPIDTASATSGCEASDFAPASDAETQIALVKRGTCTFGVKAGNALAAGYDAVIVYNDGASPDRVDVVAGTLGAPVDIPAVGTSFDLGPTFAGEIATVSIETISELRDTSNVLAELPGRTSDNVVMAGAHLDSVAAGPGINDNGSGSAALIEVAENLGKVKPTNTVRFAWWGAEELGLQGSNYYVANLPQADKDRIGLYLNFDMVGSPNFARFIYDGDQSTFPAPTGTPVPEGSADIEYVLEDYYEAQGLWYEGTEFSGRSDYQAFIRAGIPSGGLFTGAEVAKKPYQVPLYGGTPGVAYDPNYHQAGDTITNVNRTALDQNSDAIAYSVLTLAYDTARVNGVAGTPVPGGTFEEDPTDRQWRVTAQQMAGGGGLSPDHDHDHDHGGDAV
ncbi:PA domain-containing protein [Geodermatophilus dictyosporus]|uniref:PA domain-containing protein n=1 Tax=Geodermatophilus dictyosporus TaxID=1523247 RepID=A0A1I5NMI3_9ACTN|nr:M28 family metallopeptidase [Geodermatophilus dictyosporus]SFP23019.1 PA domain-containing protein [Geodermatophilus dictyosporus]